MPNSRWWVVLVAGLAGGCQGARSPAALAQEAADRAELAAVQEQGLKLSGSLNRVEGGLFSSRTTVKLWEELSRRHGSVSAIACRNAETHAEGIAWHESRLRNGREAHRVAENTTSGLVMTDVHVTGYRTAASVLSPQQREGRTGPAVKK